MRYVFKTRYDQDIDIVRYRSDFVSYGLLMAALIAAPFVLSEYFVGEIAFLFVFAIGSVGLMLLAGYAGLVSLGHAAFMGIGAYAHAILLGQGVPFVVSLPIAALISGAIGTLLGIPALRMTGLYLAIATLAFAVIVEHVLGKWESLTQGHGGMQVPDASIFGFDLGETTTFYFVSLVVLMLVLLGAINLLRSQTGRALISIRDSEIAAQALGVNLVATKVAAFGLSAAITGIAGALFAHKITWLEPASFNVILSLQLLMMVVIGGLGSLHGAVFGAVFLGLIDPVIAIAKDYLPAGFGGKAGLQLAVFGLLLVVFVLFEPLGLYGRWLKIKAYFKIFPMYRRATFERGKSYMQSERYR